MARRYVGTGSVYPERGKWVAQVAIGPRGHQRKYRRTRDTREEAELALLDLPRGPGPVDRFWGKVDKTPTCWLWTGSTDGNGYGKLTIENVDTPTHRFSYRLEHGVDPGNLFVCHACDVKLCVRPSHLFLGTQADNMADYAIKRQIAIAAVGDVPTPAASPTLWSAW